MGKESENRVREERVERNAPNWNAPIAGIMRPAPQHESDHNPWQAEATKNVLPG